MSVLFRDGDIFTDSSEAMVNPVNCLGVMGKGVALKFKEVFPENYKYYKSVCDDKLLTPGKCLPFIENKKVIFNFPTKYHWAETSRYEYIEEGLITLLKLIQVFQINSISIPALGCGLGGLNWLVVKEMLFDYLDTTKLTIIIYEPKAK